MTTNRWILGSLLLALLWMGRSFAQTPPPPSPPTPTPVQGTLFSLPGRGWEISNSGDVYREGDSAGLTGWTPAGGAITLVPEDPDFGLLGIVNAGLAVYTLENSKPFTTLLTAVDLATGARAQITLGESFLGAAGSLGVSQGKVFLLGSQTSSVSGSVFAWTPGGALVEGPAVTDHLGVVHVSSDAQSLVVEGSAFVGPGVHPQFYFPTLGPQDFPSTGVAPSPDGFRAVLVMNEGVMYETSTHEIKFWRPDGISGLPPVEALGTVPAGWDVRYLAGSYGVKVQNAQDETRWFVGGAGEDQLASNDTFFRGLLAAYGIDASAIPTITGGDVASETGDLIFQTAESQYYVTAAVPEPGPLGMILLGLTAVVLWRGRGWRPASRQP